VRGLDVVDPGCRAVVSGDRHLLDLGACGEIEIISPAQFIARWSA
jgi:hypothetical protein